MSVLGKLYDKILLRRSESWFQRAQSQLQGANREQCSSLHTSLILQEAVAQHVEKGKVVYVTLLDTQKAFDTVWQNGLFYKLKQYNMDPKLWRIIKNTYDDFQCAVRIGGELSDWFVPKQGIHQGDILSMRLYGVFINDLLKELQQTDVERVNIGTTDTSSPGFADDVAIANLNRQYQNKQLKTAHQYSCK